MALAADNELHHELYLKGGNALALIYRSTDRASLDLDFSIENEFQDLEAKRQSIERALAKEFANEGYHVFDVTLDPRPQNSQKIPIEGWGGYKATFKLIREERARAIGGDIQAVRREAIAVNPNKSPKMEIDISKHEYIKLTAIVALGDVEVQVYKQEAIIYEKLRAICQQMPAYKHRANGKPRARDFYDIHVTLRDHSELQLLSADNLKHAMGIFKSKDVDPALLLIIEDQYSFHLQDWASVTQSLKPGTYQDFRFYFDDVKKLAVNLHSHWDV